MTTKDYKILARRLNFLCIDLRRINDSQDILSFDKFVSALCFDLKEDNPNFASATFRDAIYQEE